MKGPPLWLDREAVRDALSPRLATNVLHDFLAQGNTVVTPSRTTTETVDGAHLLVMPASVDAGTGVKLVTVQSANRNRGLPLIHGVYVLFAPETLVPVAFLDGGELTRVRTAAVSLLAACALASPDATRMVIFGAGTQADAHARAFVCHFRLERVTIVHPREAAAHALVDALAADGISAAVGEPDAVSDANLICCCTTACTPLFPADWVAPGTHITAIGSYTPEARELDTATVARAKLVVDDRSAALAEAGDVIQPLRAGAINQSHIMADLIELIVDRTEIRTDPSDVTLFKAVGLAWEDLVLAIAAVKHQPT